MDIKDAIVGMRVEFKESKTPYEGNVSERRGSLITIALSPEYDFGWPDKKSDATLGRKARYWNTSISALSPVIDSGWILGAWYDWDPDATDPEERFQQIVEIDEFGFGYATMFPPHTENDFAPYPFDKYPHYRISDPCAIGVIPWDDAAKVAKESVPEPTPVEIVYDSIELARIYSNNTVPKDTARPRVNISVEPFTKVSYRPLLRCGVHIDEDE